MALPEGGCWLPPLWISCTVYMGRLFMRSRATALLTLDSSRRPFCSWRARLFEADWMSSRVMRFPGLPDS